MSDIPLLSDDDALILDRLRSTGGLSPEERAEADQLLNHYYDTHSNPQTNPDLEADAVSALQGDGGAALRVVEGLSEEALNMATSFSTGVRRLGVGAVKMPLLAMEALAETTDFDFSDQAEATMRRAINGIDDWYAEKKREELDFFRNKFDQEGAAVIPALAGEFLPLMAFPVANTYKGALTLSTLEGALGTGAIASVDAETFDDILSETTYGALFGFGAGAVFNAVPGMRAYTSRKFAGEMDNANAKTRLELEKRIREMTGDENFAFTVGQIAAENPWLLGFQRGAAGRATMELQNRNIQTLVDFIEGRANRMTPAQILADLNQSITRVGREMNAVARQRYGNALESIYVRHGEDLAMSRQNAQGYLDDLNDFIAELADPRHVNAMDPGALIRHQQFVHKKVNPFTVVREIGEGNKVRYVVKDTRGIEPDAIFSGRGSNTQAARFMQNQNDTLGGLQSEDIIEILKGHNALISGEASAFNAATSGSSEHIGRRLMRSMSENMEGTSGAAIADIRAMRNMFNTEMQKIGVLRDSALGKILGDNYTQNGILDPQATLNQLIHLGEDAMRQTRQILDTYDPAALDALKGAVMRNILRQSRDTATGDVLNEVDLVKLLEVFEGGGGATSNIGRVGQGLFSPQEQQHIIDAAKGARVLMNTYVKDVYKDTAGFMADASINVVSLTGAFMARFVVRSLTKGSTAEQVMVNPHARQALIELADKGVNSPTGRAAIASLAMIIGNLEGTRMGEEREKILEQQRAQFPERE